MVLQVLGMSLLLVVGCSHKVNKPVPTPTAKAAAEVGGTHYATLEFEKGTSKLSEASKANLNALATRASRDGRKIEEIKILSWADQEYPDRVKGKAKTSEIILAKERGEKIKEYLKDDLHAREDIDAFNMAKRPNLLSKMFKDEDFSVKDAFEKSGATGTKLNDGNISYSKASKALVIIDYENNSTNN